MFTISIEPLALLIRDNEEIGVLIGTEEHKISLYADYVILYLFDPTCYTGFDPAYCIAFV